MRFCLERRRAGRHQSFVDPVYPYFWTSSSCCRRNVICCVFGGSLAICLKNSFRPTQSDACSFGDVCVTIFHRLLNQRSWVFARESPVVRFLALYTGSKVRPKAQIHMPLCIGLSFMCRPEVAFITGPLMLLTLLEWHSLQARKGIDLVALNL